MGLGGAATAAKTGTISEPYEPIPYASEQGIFCGLAGNLNRRSGKIPPASGNPALVRYFARVCPSTNPILLRDIEPCRRKQRGLSPRCIWAARDPTPATSANPEWRFGRAIKHPITKPLGGRISRIRTIGPPPLLCAAPSGHGRARPFIFSLNSRGRWYHSI